MQRYDAVVMVASLIADLDKSHNIWCETGGHHCCCYYPGQHLSQFDAFFDGAESFYSIDYITYIQ